MRMIGLSALMGLLAGCSAQNVANTITPTGGFTRTAGIDYGDLPRQKLDVYVPDDAGPETPVVVYFYGGRWSEGERQGYKFAAQALTSRGYIVVVPDYRLYPSVRFPAFVEDGAAAVKWVLEQLPGRVSQAGPVFLMGHSAGAHIAAMLTLDPTYLRPAGHAPTELAGFIGLAGPYDFLPLEADDLRDMFGPPERFPASQPINYVDGSNPPLLLLHGDADQSVYPKNSRHLAQKVSQAGGPVSLKIYEGLGHIRIIGNLALPLRWTSPQLEDIDAFIRETLADRLAEQGAGARR